MEKGEREKSERGKGKELEKNSADYKKRFESKQKSGDRRLDKESVE